MSNLLQKIMKTIPKIKNEEEEIEFWNENDSTEFIDWTQAKLVTFLNLKRSKKEINIQLDSLSFEKLIAKLKKEDLPIEYLINKFIEEGLNTSNK